MLPTTLLAMAFLMPSNSFSADITDKVETFDISERISGSRVYVGLGADNVGEREDYDPYIYGLVEIASPVYDDITGLRFRGSADVSEIGAWAGAGISIEHVFEENPFYVELSILAGLYTDFGDFDLDHAVEFRSQVAVGYHFENGYDMAIGYSHKSNAGIGDSNPGSEALYLRVGHAF